MKELISAISTALGRGGVAIIRVSGEGALSLAKKMFSRKGEFVPNMMYPGEIDCGQFRDYGMCVYFRAPKSFTGEDVVEFHCHGGQEIARGVFLKTLALGARAAERGEFTKRAFLNGKLSLSAAEGMADMINAESRAEVRAGYSLYTERLTQEGKRLQALLTTCLASIDADVDYPEEDLNADSRAEISEKLHEVEGKLTALLGEYRTGKKIKSGVSVAICGRPNAGKSSLLNALLGYEKAIVSGIAGTTRDVIEGNLEIKGVLFRLTDTAGLRESADEVEREGIRRAKRVIDTADVIVYLKEEETPPAFPEGVPVITVGAKCDLERKVDCDILLSSVTGEGIEELKTLLFERGYGQESDVFLLEERHFLALTEAKAAVCAALEAVESGLPAELYAEDVKRAWEHLGTISGETASESVITEIFEKFCVGK
ncbi:MAG: tRNA uridine-5-carboxymethylaminomethyl(34) synthesis GTPase MnmE [Clostridia bacterium]|nr:tRNA uridine-5-carboxymethylaminomethyl(34) synthesis GTPase MnmE [Clostridia bacterium]